MASISSDPEGATLSFNGLPAARCTKTPCSVELGEGGVRIIAALEQYEIADTTVSIKQNNQSIRIRMKANFGVLEIKPAYSDGIGSDERWSLSINGKSFSSFENRLSPNKYKVELSHRCYEDISFEAGINKDKREVFNMANNIRLKKGGLVLNAEADDEPVSEPVFVNGVRVGETPFSGSMPMCAKVEIGEGREVVDVIIKHNESVKYTHKMNTEERRRRLAAERLEAEQQEWEWERKREQERKMELEEKKQKYLASFKEPWFALGFGGLIDSKGGMSLNPEFVSVADGHLSFGADLDVIIPRKKEDNSYMRIGPSAKLSFFEYRWLYLKAGTGWYRGPSFSVGGGLRLFLFVDVQYYITPMNNRNASSWGIKGGFSFPYGS
ncbi:MAG: PEGA domain-containing protein [Fibromonadaceae bacterium]|nr:PEGA domain-containing protein [Fibromonadaceae bacterium]